MSLYLQKSTLHTPLRYKLFGSYWFSCGRQYEIEKIWDDSSLSHAVILNRILSLTKVYCSPLPHGLWISTRLRSIFRKAPGLIIHNPLVSPSHKTKGQKTSRPQRLLNSWPYSSIVLNPCGVHSLRADGLGQIRSYRPYPVRYFASELWLSISRVPHCITCITTTAGSAYQVRYFAATFYRSPVSPML